MSSDILRRIAEHDGRHLRVLGPPAAGKTRALVARFERLSADGHNPVVITFSRAQRERIVARILPRRSAFAGRIPVYTYHQLALDVLARAAPLARRPLDDVEERVVLARVIDDIGGVLESDLATIARSDGLARSLLSIVHTLEQNGVSTADATSALDAAKGRRTRDILRVFARFQETLELRGLSTYYTVAWRAARALQGGAADPMGECGALLVDDFHDIDPGQFALVEALAPPDGERLVTVFGDPTGARFGFRGTSARFLDEAFPQRYRGDDLVLALPPSGLGPVAGALLAAAGVADTGRFASAAAGGPVGDLPLFAGNTPPAGSVEVTLTVADDDIAEAQHVARACARLIDRGTAPGDVAVIARDRGRYELVLAHAFDEFGVPLDTGSPLHHELETFSDALLGLLEPRLDERLAETVKASPLFRALGTGDLDALVSRLARECIDGKTHDLRMDRFFDVAVRPAAAMAGAPVSDGAVAAVARMADEWSAYDEMTRQIGARPSIAEFRRRHRASVSLERDTRCVAFHTAREAATHTFRVAFVVGCADGVFPALDARESYVPYEELESLFADRELSFYEARDRAARLRDEYGLMLSALTRAHEAVHASAPLRLAGEELAAPARILEPLLSGADRVTRTEGPRTRAARLVAAAGHGSVDSGVAAGTARVWLDAPLETRRFTVDPFAMSPSSVGTYVDCPRKLFYGRILRIDEEKTVYLTLGDLFHKAMEKAGREFPSREDLVAGLGADRIARFVDEVVANSGELGPRGSLMESLTRHYLNRMVAQAVAIERTRTGNFRIEPEQLGEFERNGKRYVGRLDRIDRSGDVPGVLVDYKASAKLHRTGKSIRENMLNRDSDNRYWQVPMYCYAARTEGRYPDLFCYYVVPPGEEEFVVGVFVNDDPKRDSRQDVFDQPAKRFATVAPHEVDAVMDEIDGIYDEIFAERERFPRTDNLKRCEYCSFAGVCERRQRS